MKSAIICCVALLVSTAAYAQTTGSPIIVAPDGTYLGNLNSNQYDPNSVSNPYGRYGNPYSPDSINNPYGQYGNPYSPNSVTNPYATGTQRRR
jgi:hypothetical protein